MYPARSHTAKTSEMEAAPIRGNAISATTALNIPQVSSPSVRGHLEIARVDHWIKNVFVFPGVVVALSLDPTQLTPALVLRFIVGLLSTCLIASSNYVINEVIDAPADMHHPTKFTRPG